MEFLPDYPRQVHYYLGCPFRVQGKENVSPEYLPNLQKFISSKLYFPFKCNVNDPKEIWIYYTCITIASSWAYGQNVLIHELQLTWHHFLQTFSLQVTCKFKCVVRVVTLFPSRPEDFCSPNGTYRLRLTLEDPTARIRAFLYAEDGVKIFAISCKKKIPSLSVFVSFHVIHEVIFLILWF